MDEMRRIVRDGYDSGRYAEAFRQRSELTSFERRLFDDFLSLLPPQPTIIDFGCGTGVPYDRHFVERGADLTGLDISRTHLEQARANVPEARFLEADFSHWTPAQTVDGVVSLYAIFHIPRDEHEALLVNIARSVRPGGALLCTLAAEAQDGSAVEWLGVPMAWSAFEPSFYFALLERLGFTIVRREFEGKTGDEEHHLWLIASKNSEPAG